MLGRRSTQLQECAQPGSPGRVDANRPQQLHRRPPVLRVAQPALLPLLRLGERQTPPLFAHSSDVHRWRKLRPRLPPPEAVDHLGYSARTRRGLCQRTPRRSALRLEDHRVTVQSSDRAYTHCPMPSTCSEPSDRDRSSGQWRWNQRCRIRRRRDVRIPRPVKLPAEMPYLQRVTPAVALPSGQLFGVVNC